MKKYEKMNVVKFAATEAKEKELETLGFKEVHPKELVEKAGSIPCNHTDISKDDSKKENTKGTAKKSTAKKQSKKKESKKNESIVEEVSKDKTLPEDKADFVDKGMNDVPTTEGTDTENNG